MIKLCPYSEFLVEASDKKRYLFLIFLPIKTVFETGEEFLHLFFFIKKKVYN